MCTPSMYIHPLGTPLPTARRGVVMAGHAVQLCPEKGLSRHGKGVRFVMALLVGISTVRFVVIYDAYFMKSFSLSVLTKCGKDLSVCSLEQGAQPCTRAAR